MYCVAGECCLDHVVISLCVTSLLADHACYEIQSGVLLFMNKNAFVYFSDGGTVQISDAEQICK
jgi:hypothetical protein